LLRPWYDAGMAEARKRRIAKCLLMAIVVVVLLGVALTWLATREPPEIARSRALWIGMTEEQVLAVMGSSQRQEVGGNGSGKFLFRCYGQSQGSVSNFANDVRYRLGFAVRQIPLEDWPVRVFFRRGKQGFYVDRIERGGEVEELRE